MSLIRLKDVSKKFEHKQVLRKVHFRLEQGDRVGLIGINGVGKTTVLKMILGREEPTEGQIERDEDLQIGYFSQFSELSGDVSIEQVLEDLFASVRAVEAELRQTEEALARNPEGRELDRLLHEYQTLVAEMEHRDGWTYHNRIDTVLTKLGLTDEYRHRPIDLLSGGWRNWAALAKILLEAPNVRGGPHQLDS